MDALSPMFEQFGHCALECALRTPARCVLEALRIADACVCGPAGFGRVLGHLDGSRADVAEHLDQVANPSADPAGHVVGGCWDFGFKEPGVRIHDVIHM